MNTYDLFKDNSTSTNVKSALNSRYPDASCDSFNTELSNVWGNFYQQKINVIGPV